MSGLSLQVDIADLASPKVTRLVNGLSQVGRATLHEMVMGRALDLTRNHLIEIAQTRHETANRLGANPSGHWAQAAEKTTGTSDAESATISVHQPGIGRAMHDVTIEPGAGKKFLTIPLRAEAYNQRAYRVPGLFVPKGKRVLAKQGPGDTLEVWYALVSSVTQRQDRTLLPSDAEYTRSALQGVRDYVDLLLAQPDLPSTT